MNYEDFVRRIGDWECHTEGRDDLRVVQNSDAPTAAEAFAQSRDAEDSEYPKETVVIVCRIDGSESHRFSVLMYMTPDYTAVEDSDARDPA